jgi:hypothetical protein
MTCRRADLPRREGGLLQPHRWGRIYTDYCFSSKISGRSGWKIQPIRLVRYRRIEINASGTR